MTRRQTVISFLMSAGFLAISAIGILLISLFKAGSVGAYISAGVFWVGLFLQQVLFWRGNAGRKQLEKKEVLLRMAGKYDLGILVFGANQEGRLCDVVFLIALVAVILEAAFHVKYEWLITLTLAIVFLSFQLHCILNGRNYRYMKAYFKHLQKKEHSCNS